MYSIAVGCSHTVGVGVEPHEAWPNLLGAVNLGVGGCSADYIARNMPKYLTKYNPNLIYTIRVYQLILIEFILWKQRPMGGYKIIILSKLV